MTEPDEYLIPVGDGVTDDTAAIRNWTKRLPIPPHDETCPIDQIPPPGPELPPAMRPPQDQGMPSPWLAIIGITLLTIMIITVYINV